MRGLTKNFDLSYTDIAERLSLTKNQVIAIERTALRKIKKLIADIDEDYSSKICQQKREKGKSKEN